MIPTTAEMIFYYICGGIALIIFIKMMCSKSDTVEITWGQRRDWERREKEWR
jgi:hypothetical protein